MTVSYLFLQDQVNELQQSEQNAKQHMDHYEQKFRQQTAVVADLEKKNSDNQEKLQVTVLPFFYHFSHNLCIIYVKRNLVSVPGKT